MIAQPFVKWGSQRFIANKIFENKRSKSVCS